MNWKFCFFAFFFSHMAIHTGVFAQAKPEPFENIKVHVSYQHNFNENDFHKYWDGGEALQIDLETPFYFGNFFIGGRYAEFTNLNEIVPAFRNYQFTVGWGIDKKILPRTVVGISLKSIFAMYDYENITDEQWSWAYSHRGTASSENETGFIFSGNIKYSISKKIGGLLTINRSIVYTNKRIKLNYVGAGIFIVLDTPNWLQNFLK